MSHLPRIIVDHALFCPHCGARHVDESRNGEKWHRRAHTTHRCQSCGKDFDVYVSGAQAEPEDAATQPTPRARIQTEMLATELWKAFMDAPPSRANWVAEAQMQQAQRPWWVAVAERAIALLAPEGK